MIKRLSPVPHIALAAVMFAGIEIALILFVDAPFSHHLRAVDDRYPALIDFFRSWTDLGRSCWYLWPASVAALFCFVQSSRPRLLSKRRSRWRRRGFVFSFIFVCVGLSGIITDIIKPLVGRARPVLLQRENYYGFDPLSFHAAHNSFPSGHATTAFALAFALLALRPRWRPWFIAFALALSISRIMVNAHFLSDVIAGAVVGALTAIVVRKFFERQGWLTVNRGR